MIEIKSISKSYYDQNVVGGVSLEIKRGSIFGFLGPNGAGKTTTMKMIIGLNRPDNGNVLIDGLPPYDISVKEKIGFKPEEPHFYSHLTGLEFMRFAGQLFKKSYNKTDSEYLEILKASGLGDAYHKLVKNYSKGMKQRLGFAQALVNDPDYIFMDEPLEGLDPIGRRELKTMVKGLHQKGKTIFFNSHILSDVETICDQIGIINKGRLIYSGTVVGFCQDKNLEDKFVEAIEESSHNTEITSSK